MPFLEENWNEITLFLSLMFVAAGAYLMFASRGLIAAAKEPGKMHLFPLGLSLYSVGLATMLLWDCFRRLAQSSTGFGAFAIFVVAGILQ